MNKQQTQNLTHLSSVAMAHDCRLRVAGRTGSGHVRLDLQHRKTGRKARYVVSFSPSDWRSLKNAESTLKRLCRELAEPVKVGRKN